MHTLGCNSRAAQYVYSILGWWINLPGVHVKIIGLQNVPPNVVIAAANHPPARLYTFLPWYALRRNPASFIAAELWTILPLGWLFWRMGNIPVVRYNKRLKGWARKQGAQKLRSGVSVFLCPEGKHSRRGMVGPFHYGAAWMALESGVPILCFGITVQGRWPARRIELRIGKLIYPGSHTVASLTAAVRQEIAELTRLPLQCER